MTKAFEIKRGTFQLTRTVENPTPRKRGGQDWRCMPEWTGGTYFIIEDFPCMREEAPLAVLRLPRNQTYDMAETDPRFWLIVRHLIEVEEEPSDIIARLGSAYGSMGPEVLDYLAKAGKITTQDVHDAIAGVREGWEREEQERVAAEKR